MTSVAATLRPGRVFLTIREVFTKTAVAEAASPMVGN